MSAFLLTAVEERKIIRLKNNLTPSRGAEWSQYTGIHGHRDIPDPLKLYLKCAEYYFAALGEKKYCSQHISTSKSQNNNDHLTDIRQINKHGTIVTNTLKTLLISS